MLPMFILILFTFIPTFTCELIQVHIIFRHGDRTADAENVDYNHGNKDNGKFGQLTDMGKLKMLNLGRLLRMLYKPFIKTYSPELVEARTTDLRRSKESLLLVLSEVFPPSNEWTFLTGLSWQPLSYDYKNRNSDTEFFGVFCECFQKKLIGYFRSEQFKNETLGFEKLRYHLELSRQVITPQSIYFLYMKLKILDELKKEMPYWSSYIYPEPIKTFALKIYKFLTATDELKQYSIGFMLKKIFEDNVQKIHRETDKKFILLSGHDIHIGMMLEAIGIFRPHLPAYGAQLIFELHQIDRYFGYKILYNNGVQTYPKLQYIPNCGYFCPINKFHKLFAKYIPNNKTKCNYQ